MNVLVTDPELGEHLIAQRRLTGGDRFDEVWEGIYVMAPLADNDHQLIQTRLAIAFQMALGFDHPAQICAGVNVSDRTEGWTHNYRCPDVAVFLPGTTAHDRGTFWEGGPDLAVEIASPNDRSREKLDFYARVGVRELLLIDRDPWALELYALQGGRLALAGRATPGAPALLASGVLPVTFGLAEGPTRPMIEVSQTAAGGQRWRV